jgi:hypothetical protein
MPKVSLIKTLAAALGALALCCQPVSAATPISGFPAASTPLTGTEVTPCNQAGVTVQCTTLEIAGLASASYNSAVGWTTTPSNSTQAYLLFPRAYSSLSFPVPFFRPTQANTTIALDIYPNGTPTENVGNGYAWTDTCDTDVSGGTPYNSNNATRCGRIGARSDRIQIGEKVFGGRTPTMVDYTVPNAGGVDQDGLCMQVTLAFGFGTCSPYGYADFYLSQAADTGVYVRNDNASSSAFAEIGAGFGANRNFAVTLVAVGANWTPSAGFPASAGIVNFGNQLTGGAAITTNVAGAPISFYPGHEVRTLTLDGNQHAGFYSAAVPVVTSCGTGSPAIVAGSTDASGAVTIGTSATSCTVTFRIAYTNAPFCTISDQTLLANLTSYTVSATAIVLTMTSNSGNQVDYHCFGA